MNRMHGENMVNLTVGLYVCMGVWGVTKHLVHDRKGTSAKHD